MLNSLLNDVSHEFLGDLRSWLKQEGYVKAPFGSLKILNGAILWSGSGVPAVTLGDNGNYYFRTDTPGTANQRIYVKSAGAWVGIV